jgi:segregation and condensation protein A
VAVFDNTQYLVQLPAFEGPLDLLVHLIEREELDITTISLAQVTGQYLTYLAHLDQKRVSDLAAFLVVAAKLVLIKSQVLLPRPPVLDEEEEDVGEDLVEQLRLYKKFKELALRLREREDLKLRSYARIAPRPQLTPHLNLASVTLDDLVAAAREALNTLPATEVGEVITPTTVTIWQQIEIVEAYVWSRDRVRFRDMLSTAATRVEIIITLLAILELVKRDRLVISQERMFGEILIERKTASVRGLSSAQATVLVA